MAARGAVSMDFEFGLLGPLRVTAAAVPVPVPGERQRVLLAMLLLRANHTVGISQLVNAVWGEDPPLTARRQVQNGVSLLRRALDDAGGGDLIRSEPDGYHLSVPADRLDLSRFERCLAEGRRLAAAGEPATAAQALRLALSCWRGPALGELANGPLQREAERLDEQRLAALEECAELELACGSGAGLVDELSAALAEHPLRERLAATLMLALYRVGRQAEALAVYQRTAETLAEQLGIDPGAELRQRHEAILRNDPTLACDEEGARRLEVEPPAQLPTAVRQFTGRASQLAALDRLLARRPGPGESLIVTVTGSGGVGKTALTVLWAHRVRDRFPDGQLYVDLRGRTRHDALRSLDALHQCMRSLGAAPEQIPLDLEAAAAAYRSLLADRRVLIILDNAADSSQVRPLLPGNATCLTLVTSRSRLGGLVAVEGAEEIRLDVLTQDEAITLLAGLVGEERVAAEPEAAAELAQLCAGLPLALRISAANLTGRPFGTLAEHASRLRTGNLLAHLTIPGDDGSSVRGAFHLSYHDLSEPARLMFRGLGLIDGADITPPAAAALTGTAVAAARSTLDELAAVHLIQLHAPDRYTLHDLLRLYAAECASADDPLDRAAARRRLARHYLSVADAATRLLYPHILRLTADPPALSDPAGAVGAVGVADPPALSASAGAAGAVGSDSAESTADGHESTFDSGEAALAWLDAELPNLVATAVKAAGHGLADLAVRLGDVLRGYLSHRMYTADWLAVATVAADAARAEGDLRGEAAALLSLGTLEWLRGRAATALDYYRAALAQATAAGWTEGRAGIVGNLGSVHGELGQLATAAEMLTEARALNRRLGRRMGEATNLANLAYLQISLGRLAEAADNARTAIEMHTELNKLAAANTMSNLGNVLRLQGHLQEAEKELEAALKLHRAMGNRGSEADALVTLAGVQRDAGRSEQAMQTALAALELAVKTGRQRFQADAMLVLGSLEERRGQLPAAMRYFEQAAVLARGTGYPEGIGHALIDLAGCQLALGATESAEAHVEEALELAAGQFKILQGDALTRRAEIHREAGRLPSARADAEAALKVQQETGYRLGELRARAVLGSIMRHLEPMAATAGVAGQPPQSPDQG